MHVLSCFVPLKNVLLISCVFGIFFSLFRTLAVNSVSDFFFPQLYIDECSLTSFVWARFPDGFPHYALGKNGDCPELHCHHLLEWFCIEANGQPQCCGPFCCCISCGSHDLNTLSINHTTKFCRFNEEKISKSVLKPHVRFWREKTEAKADLNRSQSACLLVISLAAMPLGKELYNFLRSLQWCFCTPLVYLLFL